MNTLKYLIRLLCLNSFGILKRGISMIRSLDCYMNATDIVGEYLMVFYNN